MLHDDRKSVVSVGFLDVPTKPFDERGLVLVTVALRDAPKTFNEARAIIIAEPFNKIGMASLRKSLSSLKSAARDYGLAFIAIASNSTLHWVQISELWKELRIDDPERIFTLDSIGNAAQSIYELDPGPGVGDAKITTSGFSVSRQKRWLLRRAFHDCDSIYLKRLGGGKNSLSVFCVDAWLKRSEVGPRPLPFFIKIAGAKEVAQELTNYHRYAEFFIPFYLRPNLDRKRCVSIGTLSSIVGNFVEDSQPLRSVLRSNPGPGILFSLFENSLKGFRLQPSETHSVREGLLEDFIRGRSRASEVPRRATLRARRLGLTAPPRKLEASLCAAVKGVNCKLGPHHGDLHSGNVMIRGKDAILIDFSAVKDGPTTADLAAIEVSLVFGTDADDKPNEQESWKRFVKEIYEESLHPNPPLAERTPGPHSWLRRAVREIHHVTLGCDCSVKEKNAVIAAYLIRFARLAVEEFEDKRQTALALDRHAYALVVAEHIVQSLTAPK